MIEEFWREYPYTAIHADILNAFMPPEGVKCDKKHFKAFTDRIDKDYQDHPDKYEIVNGCLNYKEVKHG